MDGALPPGLVLRESDQSQRLGISRTPLREAFSRLEADGLVHTTTGRRTQVAPVSRQTTVRLFEMRRSLEELAARLAARRRESGVFASLATEFADAAHQSFEGSEQVSDYYRLNHRFDEVVARSADNDYLGPALRTIRFHAARVRRIAQSDPDRLRASARETEQICRAIDMGDEELAAHATHLHLHNSLQHILSSFSAEMTEHEPAAAREATHE